jgi:hypothetical protein
MDEFEFIAALTKRFTRDGTAGALLVDIGDDAAVLHADARPLVVSVDASVEGVHFLRDFAPAEDLGYRALMAAASDLGAMGADPESALLALIIAPGTPRDWLLALADGYAEAAEVCGLRVVGGNVSRGDALSMTTTVLGRMPEGTLPLRRQGARVGDDVYVSGPVGSAALGLAGIRAGTRTTMAQHASVCGAGVAHALGSRSVPRCAGWPRAPSTCPMACCRTSPTWRWRRGWGSSSGWRTSPGWPASPTRAPTMGSSPRTPRSPAARTTSWRSPHLERSASEWARCSRASHALGRWWPPRACVYWTPRDACETRTAPPASATSGSGAPCGAVPKPRSADSPGLSCRAWCP